MGTVFLGERVSPCGNRRLIAINLGWVSSEYVSGMALWHFSLTPQVFRLGDLAHDPQEVGGPYIYADESIIIGKGDTVAPGPTDPADRSHISIHCVLDSKPVDVNGWLTDDDRIVWDRQSSGDLSQRQ